MPAKWIFHQIWATLFQEMPMVNWTSGTGKPQSCITESKPMTKCALVHSGTHTKPQRSSRVAGTVRSSSGTSEVGRNTYTCLGLLNSMLTAIPIPAWWIDWLQLLSARLKLGIQSGFGKLNKNKCWLFLVLFSSTCTIQGMHYYFFFNWNCSVSGETVITLNAHACNFLIIWDCV